MEKLKWCLKIHKSQLPKKLKLDYDKDGWLEGYLIFTEKDYKATFMNDKFQFECSRPVIITQTHQLIKYSTVVYTGYNNHKKQIGEICELTFFFNYYVMFQAVGRNEQLVSESL